jgi:hypothetical protein
MKKLLAISSVFFILTGCNDQNFSNEKITLEKIKKENNLLKQKNKEYLSFINRYNHVKLSLYDDLIEINKSFAPDIYKEKAIHYLFIPKDIKSKINKN